MDKELINRLKLLVNDPSFRDIRFYVEYRKELLNKQFLYAEDFDEVSRLKGQIQELERLLTLRDEVLESEKRLLDNA